MSRKIFGFLLLIMSIGIYFNHSNIKISALIPGGPPGGPYYCQNVWEERQYGSPRYEWDGQPSIQGDTLVYDRDLTGVEVRVTQRGTKIIPYTQQVVEVCKDAEGTIFRTRIIETISGDEHVALNGSGSGNWSLSSGSISSGRVNYTATVWVTAYDGLTSILNPVEISATSYWVTGVSVGASSSTIEGEGTPSATYCNKTYGNGHSTSCSTSSSYTENSQRRIYTFRYTDPYTGASGSAQSTMWFFDRVELSYSGASEILVDSVRGYSRADNDNTTCRLHYHNGATRNCSGNVSINERYGGWSIGDGTRIKRYSYTYTGPVSGNRDTGSATKTFYYVTDVEFRNSTNDVYVTTNARYNDANGESSLFFPTILFTIPH